MYVLRQIVSDNLDCLSLVMANDTRSNHRDKEMQSITLFEENQSNRIGIIGERFVCRLTSSISFSPHLEERDKMRSID